MIDIIRRDLLQNLTNSHSTLHTSINDLPNEILARIFWYLNPIADQLPLLAMVCRKWREILLSNGSLWRVVYVDPSEYYYWHFSLLASVFRLYGQHIQKLTWTDQSPVYENVFCLLPKLYNLKFLRLPILWTKKVVQTLSSLSGLQNVQINGGFALTDSELENIAEQFPHLREISLNACWRITSKGIAKLFAKLQFLETVKLKINSGLRINDPRSVHSMRRGYDIVRSVIADDRYKLVKVLCLHFVPVRMEELWDVVKKLPNIRKLNISNCERLHGIRLVSDSLQKMYLLNIENACFVCVNAPTLRHVTVGHGMYSMEHLEIKSSSLRRAVINGSNVLRTLRINGEKLSYLEMSHCEELDMESFHNVLLRNRSIVSLRLGCILNDILKLNEHMIPSLQELCLLSDFACETVHLRGPTLRLIHTETDNDIVTLNHMYITANHLCKVALIGMPALKTLTIQCVSVDSIEMNLCGDDQLHIESCVIHAMNAIGFLRVFDCKLNLLSVSTPLARTVVLYRCQLTDYVLQMALTGCLNIAYLNLEKCREISHVAIQAPLMRFLNMFGCADVHRLDLNHCPHLLALNIGHCPNIKLYIRGIKQDIESLSRAFEIIRPNEKVRWNHDYPPQSYICACTPRKGMQVIFEETEAGATDGCYICSTTVFYQMRDAYIKTIGIQHLKFENNYAGAGECDVIKTKRVISTQCLWSRKGNIQMYQKLFPSVETSGHCMHGEACYECCPVRYVVDFDQLRTKSNSLVKTLCQGSNESFMKDEP